MPSAAPTAHPLETLTELTTAFEASVLECLARPRKRTVHNLRTSTRRIEAQLELLSLLPDLPPHKKPRNQAIKLLGKIRQAAGKVRDLDVQGDLIRKQASSKSATKSLCDEAHKLGRALKKLRDVEAGSLTALLHKQESRLPLTLEELHDALTPAKAIALTERSLIELVRTWYAENVPAQPPTSSPPDDTSTERLHNIRKKAKLARYLAESAPKDALKARRLAAKYEDLQQAGGEWHDWLLLAALATDHLGKSSKLAARFHAGAGKSLRAYQRKLAKKI
jgi:CHAD domain-containing protein